MNIGEALHFFRTRRGLKQREVFDYSTSSIYSKLESNKQELRVSELIYFLEKVEITPEEFFDYINLNENQNNFRKIFIEASQQLNNNQLKQQILTYNFDWSQVKQKSLQDLSNYIAIHVYFSDHWEEIHPLSKDQITYVYRLLSGKKYYFEYDYILLSNTIFLFESNQADFLFRRFFPIRANQICSNTTKLFITSITNNLVTATLHRKEYKCALQYIEIAKKQEDMVQEIGYKIVVAYLYNLTKYLMTGKYLYIKKVYSSIELLNDIEELDLARNIEKEVESLTVKKDELPKSVSNLMFIVS